MKQTVKRLLSSALRSTPTLITLALLVVVAAVGHRTNWKMPAAASLVSSERPERDDWCMEHGVPESQCLICRGREPVPDGEPVAGESVPATGERAGEMVEKPRYVQLASAESVARAGVSVAAAETRAASRTIEANAELGYDMTRYAQLAPRASGSVVTVRVREGERVVAGSLLALVDSAEVGRAKAEFLQAAAQVGARGRGVERLRASTSAGFRNKADLVAAEAELREAEIRLLGARQSLVNLGLTPPEIQPGTVPDERELRFLGLPAELASELEPQATTGNLLPVVAPMEGVVIRRSAVAGELVDPSRVLFAVADTSRMWVTASLTPEEALEVAVGQEVRFTTDGQAGEPPASGKVIWVSPEVDERTRTVQVRAEVANPDGRLRAHSFGRASIVVEHTEGAVVVPSEALQWDAGTDVVFVRVNGSVFARREVSVGAKDGAFTQIRSGLRPGERVATAGSYVLTAQLNSDKLGAGCTDD